MRKEENKKKETIRLILGVIKKSGEIESKVQDDYRLDNYKRGIKLIMHSDFDEWNDCPVRWRWHEKLGVRHGSETDHMTTDQEEAILKHIEGKYGIDTKKI